MTCEDSIYLGLVILLVIIVICQCMKPASGRKGGFVAGYQTAREMRMPGFSDGIYNPYDVLDKELDTIRGYRDDGYNQPPFWRYPHGLDRYHKAGADIKPEMIAAAERDMWYSVDYTSPPAKGFNPERAYDGFKTGGPDEDEGAPAIDYGSYVVDLVVDPRTRENHQRWVEEMKPWSGVAMTVDDLEEAMEASTDFQGLRRPQAIVQYNPTQLTERDTATFAVNNKFNFKG